MNEIIKSELKEFVNRFGLSLGDLKSSPDYEQEMLLEKGASELSREAFNQMTINFKPKATMGPAKGNKILEVVETGERKTIYGWTKENLYNNKILYIHFKISDENFRYKGLTYKKVGKW